jgi:uncharacterized protein YceK
VKKAIACLAVLIPSLLSGCGTMDNMIGPFLILGGRAVPPQSPYGGVQLDVADIAECNGEAYQILGAFLALADLPFSAVADTVTLPYALRATADRNRPYAEDTVSRPQQ